MHLLLADTLRFLEENFSPSHRWIISPKQHLLLQKKTPEPIAAPPQIVKQLSAEKSPVPVKKEEAISPNIDKEVPTPIVSGSPLGIENLSKAVKDLFPEFSTQIKPPQEKDFFLDPSYKKAIKAQVVLFSFREGKESDLFLQNMARALHIYFSSSSILDMKKWEKELQNFTPFFQEAEAKLFIASHALCKKTQLLPFLKENPTSSERFLGNGKLLLLPTFSTYFHDPMQKKELWKTLCTLLNSQAPSQASS